MRCYFWRRAGWIRATRLLLLLDRVQGREKANYGIWAESDNVSTAYGDEGLEEGLCLSLYRLETLSSLSLSLSLSLSFSRTYEHTHKTYILQIFH